jgi:phospholipid/cholesterol/gamma-HCH transport system substrate-binding protein
MDRSESNKSANTQPPPASPGIAYIPPPKRTFTLEFIVGIFALIGCLAAGYLAVGLGGLQISNSGRYDLIAEFDNISGLQAGASVEIAGVPIGEVTQIYLNDSLANVVMSIDNAITLTDDDIAAIRTKGIIGDRYVKISRGGTGQQLTPGTLFKQTESVVDIEDIIGKIVHSMTGEDNEKKSE